MKTRNDHEYAARVWMQQHLADAIEQDALARIEALLPLGYTYVIEKRIHTEPSGFTHEGWMASYGESGHGWGLPHVFKTPGAAAVGLLACMMNSNVFPGCATAFGAKRAAPRREATDHA